MSLEELMYFDLIERYVDGDMTDAERVQFEQKLSSDELLKEEYDLYTQVADGITDHFSNKFKDQMKAVDLEMDLNPIHKPKSKRIILFSIAATVVVLMVSYFAINPLLNIPDFKSIASKYDEVDRGMPVLMSANDDQQFNEAMNRYKLKNYQGSLTILQELIKNKADNDTLIYYIGINYQMLNNEKSAIDQFEKIENIQNSAFKDKAEFRLAICYLKLENKKEAVAVLKKISENSQHLYQEKAIKMLGEIK